MKKPREKQLVLLISTRLEPLKAEFVYVNGSVHAGAAKPLRVLDFRLGELTKPRKRLAAANLSRAMQVGGPWDVSAANKVGVKQLRVHLGGTPKSTLPKVLTIGTKRVKAYFGPKRQELFVECMRMLNRLDLIPPAPTGNIYEAAWAIIDNLEPISGAK